MRFTVKAMRAHGSDDEHYFKTWAQVVRFMKRARKFRKLNKAISFEIYFNEKEI
jgi:hypothetical protein